MPEMRVVKSSRWWGGLLRKWKGMEGAPRAPYFGGIQTARCLGIRIRLTGDKRVKGYSRSA